MKIVAWLTEHNYKNKDVSALLDLAFGLEDSSTRSDFASKTKEAIENIPDSEWWSVNFTKHLPDEPFERLTYLVEACDSYPRLNYGGRVCQNYIWPEFFKTFPDGRIGVVQMDGLWFSRVWSAQNNLSAEFPKKDPIYADREPQIMSGLQSDNLPFTMLQLAAYQSYPLILFDFKATIGYFLLIYVPDKPLAYSPPTSRRRYDEVLRHIQHVYDDQWTFDGSRGPRSRVPDAEFTVGDTTFAIEWYVSQISERMSDILRISDAVWRETLSLTINRAITDGIIATTHDTPYIAKSFLFSLIDKVETFLQATGAVESRSIVWTDLVSKEFLEANLLRVVKTIEGTIGDDLVSTVHWVSRLLEVEELSPELLRDYRNSVHGYSLKSRRAVARLLQHSGEINNDLTLLAVPMLLYVFTRSWVGFHPHFAKKK